MICYHLYRRAVSVMFKSNLYQRPNSVNDAIFCCMLLYNLVKENPFSMHPNELNDTISMESAHSDRKTF